MSPCTRERTNGGRACAPHPGPVASSHTTVDSLHGSDTSRLDDILGASIHSLGSLSLGCVCRFRSEGEAHQPFEGRACASLMPIQSGVSSSGAVALPSVRSKFQPCWAPVPPGGGLGREPHMRLVCGAIQRPPHHTHHLSLPVLTSTKGTTSHDLSHILRRAVCLGRCPVLEHTTTTTRQSLAAAGFGARTHRRIA